VEGSVHNALRGLRTHCYVLWSHKLASNLLDDDEYILRDLINTGEVAAFMDDILVGTECQGRAERSYSGMEGI